MINEEYIILGFLTCFLILVLEKKFKNKYIVCVCASQTSKDEIIRWEEGKKWQIRMEGLRNKLREKEKEADALAKQLNTLKDIYTK